MEICELGWWEPSDLARVLGRSRKYLAQNYLQSLVGSGRLRLRNPDAKHNPRQAYGSATLEESR